MTNSIQKGKRGERGFRDKLREHDLTSERGQQRKGGPGSPDVTCEELDVFHFEVKLRERLNIKEAYEQACKDAGNRIPVVAHRSSRQEWMITLSADDFLKIAKDYVPF